MGPIGDAGLMTPSVRKVVLAIHISASVGWLGAVAAFFALAVAGVGSLDPGVSRSAYSAMDLTTWCVIVPLSLVSFLTGIVSSLGTPWGLFRHYWVLVKFLTTLFSTIVLAVHMRPIELLSVAARKTALFDAQLHGAQTMMVMASGAALGVLLVLTVLSVYKPRGLTGFVD